MWTSKANLKCQFLPSARRQGLSVVFAVFRLAALQTSRFSFYSTSHRSAGIIDTLIASQLLHGSSQMGN